MLINLIVALIVIGVLLWAVQSLPMDPAIRQIIRVIVIVAVVLWVVGIFTGHRLPL
jgi:hypothetical protein